MINHILVRCAVRTLTVDVPIRGVKVQFQAFPKAYILTSGVAHWMGCVTTELLSVCGETPLLCSPIKGAFVYYARAIPKGEDMAFKTTTGVFNGAAYAALGGSPMLMGTEAIWIESAEAAIVSVIKGGGITPKFVAEILPGVLAGIGIAGLSKVAKAINNLIFDEPVEVPVGPAFNASTVDMCMLGEAPDHEEL